MGRLTINPNASAEYSQQKGVEYIVLQINDSKIIEDQQIQQLGQELSNYIDNYTGTNFCIDFGCVDFCSSTFLSKLMTADKELKIRRGGRALGLSNLRPGIYGLFKIIRLDRLFDMDEESKNRYEEHERRAREEREREARV